MITRYVIETVDGTTDVARAQLRVLALGLLQGPPNQPLQDEIDALDAAFGAHELDTVGVHGIADTSALETQTGAQSKADAAQTAAEGYADTVAAAAEAAANSYTDTELAGLIDSAPGALDTLNELAAALGDDADFIGTVTTALAGKVPTTRTVSTTAPLTGGGDLSADRTLAIDKATLAADTEFSSRYAAPTVVPGTTLTNQGNNPYWMMTNAARTVLYVLVTNDRVLKAYDLADEASPVLLGTSPVLGSSPAGLAVYGTKVYVTDSGDLTIKVLDVSNPASITVTTTTTYDSSGGAGGGRSAVNAAGTKILIGGPETGTNANKAVLVDISVSPPVVLGRTPAIGSTHRGIADLGSSMWAVSSRDDHKVLIVDASTPSAPVQSTSLTTLNGNTTTPLKKYGNYLYVGNYGVGYLEKWDVTTPTSPAFVAAASIGGGSEQIDLNSDGSMAFVALRSTNKLAVVRTSDMTVLYTYTLPTTVTPGVAIATTHAYVTSAGDTTNGLIYVFDIPATVSDALTAISSRISGLDSSKVNLAGANTMSGLLTFTAASAILINNAAARITFSDIPFYRTGASAMRLDAQLRILDLLQYPTGGTVLRAFLNTADSQHAVIVETAGFRFGAGGSTAPDVRFTRNGVARGRFVSTHLAADLGLSTMEIDSTGKTSAQIDALWAAAPPNGTIVSDPTNHLILVRQGGAWYKTAALTAV